MPLYLPSRVGQSSNKLWLHICMYIHVPNTFIVLLKVTSMYICRVYYIRLYQFVYLLTPVRTMLVGRRISVIVSSVHMAQRFAYSVVYTFCSLSLSFRGQIISLSARLLGETPIALHQRPVLALHWRCISLCPGFPPASATLYLVVCLLYGQDLN